MATDMPVSAVLSDVDRHMRELEERRARRKRERAERMARLKAEDEAISQRLDRAMNRHHEVAASTDSAVHRAAATESTARSRAVATTSSKEPTAVLKATARTTVTTSSSSRTTTAKAAAGAVSALEQLNPPSAVQQGTSAAAPAAAPAAAEQEEEKEPTPAEERAAVAAASAPAPAPAPAPAAAAATGLPHAPVADPVLLSDLTDRERRRLERRREREARYAGILAQNNEVHQDLASSVAHHATGAKGTTTSAPAARPSSGSTPHTSISASTGAGSKPRAKPEPTPTTTTTAEPEAAATAKIATKTTTTNSAAPPTTMSSATTSTTSASTGSSSGGRLYMVKGKRSVTVVPVPCAASSLTSGDCFVLQTPRRTFVWNGRSANLMEKTQAKTLALNLQKASGGKLAVIDQASTHEGIRGMASVGYHARQFWEVLGGDETQVTEPGLDDSTFEAETRQTVELRNATEVLARGPAVKRNLLAPTGTFWLAVGRATFVWVGSKASSKARAAALRSAENQPLHFVEHQGRESAAFQAVFSSHTAAAAAADGVAPAAGTSKPAASATAAHNAPLQRGRSTEEASSSRKPSKAKGAPHATTAPTTAVAAAPRAALRHVERTGPGPRKTELQARGGQRDAVPRLRHVTDAPSSRSTGRRRSSGSRSKGSKGVAPFSTIKLNHVERPATGSKARSERQAAPTTDLRSTLRQTGAKTAGATRTSATTTKTASRRRSSGRAAEARKARPSLQLSDRTNVGGGEPTPARTTSWVSKATGKPFASMAAVLEACRTGVLPCELLATCCPSAMDTRCINRRRLHDPEQVQENFMLFLMTAQSEGCFVGDASAETLAAGELDGLSGVLGRLCKLFGDVKPAPAPVKKQQPAAASQAQPQGGQRRPSLRTEAKLIGSLLTAAPKPTVTKKQSGQARLLDWCQQVAAPCKVEIRNFSESFADGLAMCALFHHFYPQRLDFAALKAQDRRARFTAALEVAAFAGLDGYFDVDDLVAMRRPDARSIMTFVSMVHKTLA